MLKNPEFETDESFELSDNEADQRNAVRLDKQNKILQTMQKTISMITKSMDPRKGATSNIAELLKRNVQRKHGDIAGFQHDYEYDDNDSDTETKRRITEASQQSAIEKRIRRPSIQEEVNKSLADDSRKKYESRETDPQDLHDVTNQSKQILLLSESSKS